MNDRNPQPWSTPARRWWARVCSLDKGDPGTRAKLRRCHDRVDAFTVTEALRLAGALVPSRVDNEQFGAAVDLARVLAHIRNDSSEHPMRAVGWKEFPRESGEGDRPRLAETRFRRLLLATEGEARVDAFVRLIALMGEEANVAEIADAFHWWSDPDGRVQKSWAFQYYNAANAAPVDATDSLIEENVEP